MPRDRLLLAEMIEAGERIVVLAGRIDARDPVADRDLLDALLWNFTVLGEAAAQVSNELKDAESQIPWADPVRLRNRIVHGYWSVDLDILVSAAPAINERFGTDLDDRDPVGGEEGGTGSRQSRLSRRTSPRRVRPWRSNPPSIPPRSGSTPVGSPASTSSPTPTWTTVASRSCSSS